MLRLFNSKLLSYKLPQQTFKRNIISLKELQELSNKIDEKYSINDKLNVKLNEGLQKIDNEFNDKFIETSIEKAVETLSRIAKSLESKDYNKNLNVAVSLNLGLLQITLSSDIKVEDIFLK